ncbi:HtaA domain-containing protein [Agrococcus sp. Marseille-P2731]|uniref:HtaA domain-containing protein n=1 Tax=Agrococcus sp. Marseille-P2731 TaxID=1841862 RepID=UPI00092FFF33|nr:HtaA domain-containing protein [Agrococcus sp. Marseille-P2731]
MTHPSQGEPALVWRIKGSLLGYVRGMPDGAVTIAGGAQETAEGFRFPATGQLSFGGSVTLTGHSGMMRVVIAEPSIVRTGDGWSLEIADTEAATGRLRFAILAGFDGSRATGTALTEEGADLFFGPYTAGTPLDDPRILSAS